MPPINNNMNHILKAAYSTCGFNNNHEQNKVSSTSTKTTIINSHDNGETSQVIKGWREWIEGGDRWSK